MISKPLFNLADSEFQFWKPFQYHGVQMNFNHLDAKKLTFNHPEREVYYTIFFTISHHVFTVKTENSNDPEGPQIYPEKPADLRAFCPIRYDLSFHLPMILESLPEQFCYHGGYSRYCTCQLKDDEGNDIFYQVVFRAWKERGKMRIHVESAYPLPERPSKVKKVNFWSICYNLKRNRRPPQPAN